MSSASCTGDVTVVLSDGSGALSMVLLPSTADDCGEGPCVFGTAHGFPGNISMAPARLVIDVANLDGTVVAVEADIQDPDGPNHTRLLLYDQEALVASVGNQELGSLETLQLEAGQATISHLVVSSCGGHCFEVRIESSTAVPVVPTRWSAVKGLFN